MKNSQLKNKVCALLRYYQDMGVTNLVSEQSADWYQQSPKNLSVRKNFRKIDSKTEESGAKLSSATVSETGSKPTSANSPLARRNPTLQVGGEKAEKTARETADQITSLEQLKEALFKFEGCPLSRTAKNLVLSDGNPNSLVMFVGEAPGRDEDIQGLPFVGRAGQLLDRMLTAIDRSRDDSYITNIVFWRPPGNRTPTPAEAAVCYPFTLKHIELINPKILVFLGGSAAKSMLNSSLGIMRLRGKWHDFELNGKTIPAMATLHPAYLLRQPAQKRLAWADLLKIKLRLEEI